MRSTNLPLESFEPLSPAKRALLQLRLGRRATDDVASAIKPRAGRGSVPLSFEQRRLWFLQELAPDAPTYNVPRVLRLRGGLDADALRRALDALVERNEPFRTRFELVDGEPVQRPMPANGAKLELIDLGGTPADQLEGEAIRLATEAVRRPFDLAGELLLRARLVRLESTDHLLALVTHHIVSDEGSKAVLFEEFAALYAAFRELCPCPLPAPVLQYADYSAWQREHGAPDIEGVEWWRARLAGVPALELPTDRPRPAIQTYVGARHTAQLDDSLGALVRASAREQRATPFMVLLAAFAGLLSRLSGESDLVIGVPVSGRGRPELERVIGCFTNTIAVRLDLSGDPTFAELVARARTATIDALAHQHVPFDRVVQALRPERALSRSPVFQVMFDYFDGRAGDAAATLAGLEVEHLDVDPGVAKFDLALVAAESEQGTSVEWEYSTDLFEPGSVQQLQARFERIVRAAVRGPALPLSELPLLAADEERRLLARGRGAQRGQPAGACMHELISATAARQENAIAVQAGQTSLTYGELERRANVLAGRLSALGARRGSLVGIFLERTVELPVALLAVLKTGAAYVPLDPGYPHERLRLMLEDGAVPFVLAQRSVAAELPGTRARVLFVDQQLEPADDDPPASCVAPDDLAYVIYTSGSTGRPKGVMIEHRSVVNFLLSMAREPGLGPDDVLLAVTTLSFDIAVLEIFLPLVQGARVVIASAREGSDPEQLIALIDRVRPTVMQATPATWRMLVEAGWTGRSGLRILCGGEALPPTLAQQLLQRGGELWNLYGPTEATVWCAAGRIRRLDDALTLGEPIANAELHVLDAHGQLAPYGVEGELHVAGSCLARGYLGEPELTARSFVPHQFGGDGGARLYRTGDRARRRRDGKLEYLGRLDQQIKLRGFRIELGEVEAALTRHPSVDAAAAVVYEDTPGDRRLVGYVQTGACDCDASALRSWLRELLPDYMVPAAIVPLPALPLTANGKLDRKALPSLAQNRAGLVSLTAPGTELERRLAAIAADVLGRGSVGTEDDFFMVGGDSLLAVRLIARVNAELRLRLSLRTVFEAPTIAQLAERVAASRAEAGPPSAPVRVARDARSAPPAALTESAQLDALLAGSASSQQPVNDRITVFPLSAEQQRIWFFELLEPGSPLYNMPLCLRVDGTLDTAALRRALHELVARHEILRTTFHDHDGRLAQVVHPTGEPLLSVVDLGDQSEPQREASRRAHIEAAWPFDLERGPLMRTTVIRLGEREHLLCVVLHHMAGDARAMKLLCAELGGLYDGVLDGRPSPACTAGHIDYGDYAVWQSGQHDSSWTREQLRYWRHRLAGAPQTGLGTDRPRAPLRSHSGARHLIAVGAGTAAGLEELAHAVGCTLFHVLVAGLDAALAAWTGESDIVIGTPVAGRTRHGLDDVIGYLGNTVALRTDATGDPSFLELTKRARETVLGAFDHQEVPFERVVRECDRPRIPGRAPLFDVLLMLQDKDALAPTLGSLPVSLVEVDRGVARFELTVSVTPRDRGLRIAFEYATALFDGDTVQRFAEDLAAILERVAREPGLPLSAL